MALHMNPSAPTVPLVDPTQHHRTMYADYRPACGLNPHEIDHTAEALGAAMHADLVTGTRLHGRFGGVELVRRLRDGQRRNTPLIILNACVLEADQRLHSQPDAACSAQDTTWTTRGTRIGTATGLGSTRVSGLKKDGHDACVRCSVDVG
jgi:CheY-like chemotaxis protein